MEKGQGQEKDKSRQMILSYAISFYEFVDSFAKDQSESNLDRNITWLAGNHLVTVLQQDKLYEVKMSGKNDEVAILRFISGQPDRGLINFYKTEGIRKEPYETVTMGEQDWELLYNLTQEFVEDMTPK